MVAASAASTLRRSSGSVLEARRLSHHIGSSSPPAWVRVRPSSSSVSTPCGGGPGAHPVGGGGGVGDGGVDLAGRGSSAARSPMTVLSGRVLLAERRERVHRREHAGVGEPEVAEVVVRAVLAAEHGVVAGHLGLDEGVADAGAHRAGAGRGDDLGRPGRSEMTLCTTATSAASAPSATARATSRRAMRAVIALGLTGSPRSSTTKQRSASPSKARPRSASCSRTAAWRSTRFFGSSGLASWLGKLPSSSK